MADALLVQRGVEKENEIGTIIKSTKADMGDKYLLCNGDQILESDGYGDLIDYLGEDKYYSYNNSSNSVNTYIVPDPGSNYIYKITDSSAGMTFTTYNSFSDLVNSATPKMNLEFANYRLANGDISDICCVYTLARVYITIKDTANSKYNVLRVIRGNFNSSSNYTLYFSSGLSTSYYQPIKMVANNNYVIVGFGQNLSSSCYFSMKIIKINYTDNGDGTYTSSITTIDPTSGVTINGTSYVLTGCFIVDNYLVMQVNYSTNNTFTKLLYVDTSLSESELSIAQQTIDYDFTGIYDMIKVYSDFAYVKLTISTSTTYDFLKVKISDIFSSSSCRFTYSASLVDKNYQIYYDNELSNSVMIIKTTSNDNDKHTYIRADNSFAMTTSSTLFNSYPIPDSHLKNTKYVCIGNKIYFANNSDRSATLPNISSDDGVYTYIKAK